MQQREPLVHTYLPNMGLGLHVAPCLRKPSCGIDPNLDDRHESIVAVLGARQLSIPQLASPQLASAYRYGFVRRASSSSLARKGLLLDAPCRVALQSCSSAFSSSLSLRPGRRPRRLRSPRCEFSGGKRLVLATSTHIWTRPTHIWNLGRHFHLPDALARLLRRAALELPWWPVLRAAARIGSAAIPPRRHPIFGSHPIFGRHPLLVLVMLHGRRGRHVGPPQPKLVEPESISMNLAQPDTPLER